MNNGRIFTAPGKLVIAGEYAVLEGHEAISCAISRRVKVTVTSDTKTHFKLRRGVTQCVLKEFESRGFQVPAFQLEIDSNELYFHRDNANVKLGLGSSAAVAVAITRSLFYLLDTAYNAEQCLEIAQAAHSRFTYGSGSGIDVATSFHGGLIRYQLLKSADSKSANVIKCEAKHANEILVAVHTGIKQSTVPFLKKVKNAKSESFASYNDAIQGIAQATQTIIRNLSGDYSTESFHRLYTPVLEHNFHMQQLAVLAQAEIFTKPHQQIADIAKRYGGFAKPSGAGGDFSLCFIRPENRKDFILDVERNGFLRLDANFSDSGVESPT